MAGDRIVRLSCEADVRFLHYGGVSTRVRATESSFRMTCS